MSVPDFGDLKVLPGRPYNQLPMSTLVVWGNRDNIRYGVTVYASGDTKDKKDGNGWINVGLQSLTDGSENWSTHIHSVATFIVYPLAPGESIKLTQENIDE